MKQCDELNIIYFTKDSFVFKSTDTSTINNFVDLITLDSEDFTDSCATTNLLIFKNAGKQIFSAQVSTENTKDSIKSIGCNNVSYTIDSKNYKHSLTYRTGMGIDEIYWHNVDPKSNRWDGVDTSKFHYESIKTTANNGIAKSLAGR